MKSLLMILFFFSCSGMAHAESIKLKTGATVEGHIIERTAKYIKADFQGTTLTYYIDEIESIDGKPPTSNENSPKEASVINEKPLQNGNEYVKMGDEQFHLHHFKEASQDYQQAVGLNPQLDYAYQMLANCSANLEQYTDAVSFAKKALDINPQNAQVHVDLGYYDRALKQYPDSIEEFKAAIPVLPKSYALYMAYKGLGDSYAFMKDEDDALGSYKKAVEIQPNDSQLLFKMAGIFTYLKRFDEARKSCQKALDIFQNSGNVEGVNQSKQALMAINRAQSGT